jgi:hypothetical protein
MSMIWTALAPHLLELFSAVLMAIITWIAAEFRRRTGIEVAADARARLHSAALTAIRSALVSAGYLPGSQPSPAAIEKAVADAQAYVEASVPDALRTLGPSPDVLNNLIRSKVAEALN